MRMKAVVEAANVTHFASRFDDWRKVDLKATAQIQHHVKELARLNQAVGDFLEKCEGPDELSMFKGSILSMSKRQDSVSARLDALRTEVEVLGATVQKQGEQVSSNQRQVQEAIATSLRENLAATREALSTELTAMRRQDAAENSENFETFKSYVAEVLVGGGDGSPGANSEGLKLGGEGGVGFRSVGQSLSALHERLSKREGEKMYWKDEALKLKDEALKLKSSLQDASKEVQARNAAVEGLEAAAAKSERNLEDLRRDLQQAHAKSLSEGMRRLREIEGRGYLKVNRQSGDLKLVKSIAFKPSSAVPPVAEFVDPSEAF